MELMTRICAIDTETTSLRHDRRVWEVGIVARTDGKDAEHHWFIDTDDLALGNADVMSLKIGRFFERHPQARIDREANFADYEDESDVLAAVEAVTRGAHLVGAVVSFDADVLGQRMRASGICPSWHYHLVDVEALAAGFIAGEFKACQEVGNPDADGPTAEEARSALPPWDSHALSRAVGVDPDDFERHTALGDARWAMAIYDAVIGRPS
jgi:DNA polymerase III epsilon subunit-like protein